MTGQGVRIQKALADAAVASRRAAEALVEAGRVTVNGEPAHVGQRVRPGSDVIALDGRVVGERPRPAHVALHKPPGVTSTVADRHATRTVVDLVPDAIVRRSGRLYPVGRLDRESEGLILLTNDGAWAQRVAHPSHGVEREYAMGVATSLDATQIRMLTEGVALEEGVARARSIRLQSDAETRRLLRLVGVPPRAPRLHWYRVVLAQGWKRQVRRMLVAVGAPVVRLVRVRIGPLRLGDLAPGEARELTAAERDALVPPQGRRDRPHAPAAEARPDAVPAPAGPDVAGGPHAPRPGAGRQALRVAIDGPGSSGKSSIGAGAARELGYRFFDTGILYRGLAWLAADRSVPATDPDALVALIPHMRVADDGSGSLSRMLVTIGTSRSICTMPPSTDRERRRPGAPGPRGAAAPAARHRERVAGRRHPRGPGHRDGRAAGRRPQGLAGGVARGARPTTVAAAWSRRRQRGGATGDGRAPATGRHRQQPGGGAPGHARGGRSGSGPTGWPCPRPSTAWCVTSALPKRPDDDAGTPSHRPAPWLGRQRPPVRVRCPPARARALTLGRVRVEGLERLRSDPRSAGPLVVVANHVSNADPPLVGGWLAASCAAGRPSSPRSSCSGACAVGSCSVRG
ncbi:MAG: pseudouridine synthase [Chloroflexota bacterium]